MRLRHALPVALLLTAGSARAQVGPPPPPTEWELLQNDPDPFCPATRILFTVPQAAHVIIEIRDPATDQVLRTLVDGNLAVGLFAVVWDGRDANAVLLDNASYPYRMTASDAQLNVLFQATRFAQLTCEVGTEQQLWGQVKQLYR